MKVLAINPGFYGGSRRRAGAVFEMPDAEVAKTPWVEPAPGTAGEAQARTAQVAKAEQNKFSAGAIAASATAAAKQKKDDLDQLV